jgi:hypothetical protein
MLVLGTRHSDGLHEPGTLLPEAGLLAVVRHFQGATRGLIEVTTLKVCPTGGTKPARTGLGGRRATSSSRAASLTDASIARLSELENQRGSTEPPLHGNSFNRRPSAEAPEDRVLIVAPGGGKNLAGAAAAFQKWAKNISTFQKYQPSSWAPAPRQCRQGPELG